MKDSETRSHDECIEAAAKLDLIESMIETLEDINEAIITDDEYEDIVVAQNNMHDIAKIMRKRALEFTNVED